MTFVHHLITFKCTVLLFPREVYFFADAVMNGELVSSAAEHKSITADFESSVRVPEQPRQVNIFEDVERNVNDEADDTGLTELAVLAGGYEETTAVCVCKYVLIHPHRYAQCSSDCVDKLPW
jgi:hypothetical protein